MLSFNKFYKNCHKCFIGYQWGGGGLVLYPVVLALGNSAKQYISRTRVPPKPFYSKLGKVAARNVFEYPDMF